MKEARQNLEELLKDMLQHKLPQPGTSDAQAIRDSLAAVDTAYQGVLNYSCALEQHRHTSIHESYDLL